MSDKALELLQQARNKLLQEQRDCNFCGKRFKTAIRLANHIAVKHPKPDKKGPAFEILWRWDCTAQVRRRVWRSDWAGDQFEIVENRDFPSLLAWSVTFGIAVSEAEDD